MKLQQILLAAICVVALSAGGLRIASAFDFVWVNGSTTGQWVSRSSWQPYPNPPHIPGAGDTATFIGVYYSPTVYVPGGTMLDRMVLDYDAVVDLSISGTMNVDLISGEALLIDSKAVLNLESGRLLTADTRLLRHATLNVTGLDTAWLPDSVLVAGYATDSAGIGLALSGTASVYGTLSVGDDAASGRVVVDGVVANLFDPTSLLTVNGSVGVGTANTLGNDNFGQITLQRSGRTRVTGNVDVHGSPTATNQSKVTMQTGGKLEVAGALTIGDYGRLELFDAASQITSGSLAKSGTGGIFDWTAGTLQITNSPLFLDSNTPDSVFGSNATIGAGKRLIVSTTHQDNNFSVGRTGTGFLTLQNGGIVESFHMLLGYGAGSNGTVSVGTGSRLQVTEDLAIGYDYDGVGRLDIAGGGQVEATSLHIGAYDAADGTVVVDGVGSSLRSNAVLSVGGFIFDNGMGGGPGGPGRLTVQNGGHVDVAKVMKVWRTGSVALIGGGSQLVSDVIALEPGAVFSASGGTTVRANRLTGFGNNVTFDGNLHLGHQVGATPAWHQVDRHQSLTVGQNLVVGLDKETGLIINEGGSVTSGRSFIAATAGATNSSARVSGSGASWIVHDSLYVGGDTNGAKDTGYVQIDDDARLDVVQALTAWSTGLISINEGQIIADSINLVGGRLVGSGAIDLEGNLTNNGSVRATWGDLRLTSTSSTYVQTSSGALEIILGGTASGEFSRLLANGAAALNGTLDVGLVPGFVAEPNDTFEFLFAVGGRSGYFSNELLPDLPGGLFFDVIYGPNTVTLSVAGVPGDYNANGIVDAADYATWRDTLGSTTDLRANGNDTGPSAGVIDQADYVTWRAHFGQTAGSGAASLLAPNSQLPASSAIAEPATLVLLMIAGGSFYARRRTQHTWLVPPCEVECATRSTPNTSIRVTVHSWRSS